MADGFDQVGVAAGHGHRRVLGLEHQVEPLPLLQVASRSDHRADGAFAAQLTPGAGHLLQPQIATRMNQEEDGEDIRKSVRAARILDVESRLHPALEGGPVRRSRAKGTRRSSRLRYFAGQLRSARAVASLTPSAVIPPQSSALR